MSNTMLVSATGKTATLGSLASDHGRARADGNPARQSAARSRGDRAAGRTATWAAAMRGGAEGGGGAASAPGDSRGLWRNVRATAAVVSRPVCWCCWRRWCWCSWCCCSNSGHLRRPWRFCLRQCCRLPACFFALLITRTTFNISSFMGLIMVVGIVAKNGILLLDADQRSGPWGCRRKTPWFRQDGGGCGPL